MCIPTSSMLVFQLRLILSKESALFASISLGHIFCNKLRGESSGAVSISTHLSIVEILPSISYGEICLVVVVEGVAELLALELALFVDALQGSCSCSNG
ncbi:hypothetical protein TSMEX_002434 [Taenia solium]|eukprot:TsM_000379600 transcript=TsM_000379600 gene=TsM_000379600